MPAELFISDVYFGPGGSLGNSVMLKLSLNRRGESQAMLQTHSFTVFQPFCLYNSFYSQWKIIFIVLVFTFF